MYYLLTIWLILYHVCFRGFTDFLALDYGFGRYNGLFYLFLYIFFPILIVNYLLVFRRKKYDQLMEKFPEAKTKKLFLIHFISSWALVYIVFISIF
ncbi:MAG: hypothetical protein K0R65_856 [Crocinitomicaceae bacterium]|jgi:hypothetical protein|nr:hypothetical protein [Crocinitomicaceae bacterium]